jgi:fibronectin type 3 domain-containing protein
VTYTKNGNPPVPEQTIFFTTTRGTLTASSRTTVGGSASVNTSSANSGPAILTAYTTDGTVQVSTQVSIVFVANAAAKMTLSASPAVINTNAPGLSSEQSLIKAIVRDASDNLVMGKTVNFSIIQDASGGTLAKASATTDMYGMATTNYIAGSVTGGTNNVMIRATVSDVPTVTATTTLTVGGQALFVTLATGPTIEKVAPNKYQKNYVALVTDTGGRAVENAVITATVTPQYYLKGYYNFCGTTPERWCQRRTLVSSKSTAPTVPACANEDGLLQNSLYDFNGILDPGEDQNANSRLDPGNVASVTATTTDSTGHSTVSLVYAQDYAFWVNVRLEVRASLAGSTTSAFQTFDLPGSAKDYSDITIDPPGNPSPFGSNTTCYAALSVIALEPAKISLTWDPSAYAASYNIYRDPAVPAAAALLSNVTKTTYEDTTVTAGVTYCYEIKQVSASGAESPLSPTGNRVCVGSQSVAPTGVTATALSPTQIQVTWADAGAATYRIYQNDIPIQYSVTRSIVSANLTANTQYCYAVSSLNSEGIESAKSSAVCATTQLSPPAIPTGLIVTATSASQITVFWTASAGAAGYRVYRDGTKLSDAAAAALTDTGLTASTRYCYAVSSYDAAGNESAQTAQLCATTQPTPPPVPPPVPTGLTATAVSQSQINLSWAEVTGAAGYALYRGGTYWTTVAGTTVSDTGLLASTPYCYTIASVSSSGGASAQSSSVCVTTPSPPPPVPTGLTVTPVSASQLNVSWAASVGATGYKVYRGGVLLTTTIATTLADTGLSSGTSYCYTVSAFNATGSDSATATPACAATNTIAIPTNLTVTAATSTQINMTWTASVGAAGYRIYKDGAYLKSVTTTSATDTGLTASTTYCYSISAFDVANNESARTSQLCATTYGPPPAVPAGVTASAVSTTRVDLSWTASAGASQYKIYRNGTLLGTTTTASYSDTTAAANTAYIYTVTAIDATGSESSQSIQSAANTGLTVPSSVVSTANSSSQITVSWTNSGGVNVAGYKVYQNGTSLGAFSLATTSIVSSGLAANTQYCYAVSATDSIGNESAKSGMACTTTFGQPPAAPTNLTASAVSTTRVDLSWTASVGASSYYVYRNGIKLVPTLPAVITGISYSDTGLSANTQYSYTVTAIDVTGSESVHSAQASAHTGLTVPTLAVTVNSITQITLTLTDTGGANVTGFNVYKGGTLMSSIAKATTSIVDSGLTAHTQYCYAVSATDGLGNESAKSGSVCAVTDKAAPASPASLTVTAVGATQINLTWPVSAGATGYKIYKDGTYLKSVTTTSTADTGLTANTRYCYAVSAYDVSGNESPQTSPQCATTNVSAPPTPTGLTAAAASAVQVDLTWNQSVGATGYNVYRNDLDASGVATGWRVLGSVPDSGAGTTSVSDVAPTWSVPPAPAAPATYPRTHMEFCYSVSAFTGVGGSESPRSAMVCLATP